jgi:propanediol dehydratase large subunit
MVVVDLAVEAVEAVVDRIVLSATTDQEMVEAVAVAEARVELVEWAVMEEVLPLEFTSMLMALMEVWLIVSFKQET